MDIVIARDTYYIYYISRKGFPGIGPSLTIGCLIASDIRHLAELTLNLLQLIKVQHRSTFGRPMGREPSASTLTGQKQWWAVAQIDDKRSEKGTQINYSLMGSMPVLQGYDFCVTKWHPRCEGPLDEYPSLVSQKEHPARDSSDSCDSSRVI